MTFQIYVNKTFPLCIATATALDRAVVNVSLAEQINTCKNNVNFHLVINLVLVIAKPMFIL